MLERRHHSTAEPTRGAGPNARRLRRLAHGAAFAVDYVDGPGEGPAVIAVVPPVSTPPGEAPTVTRLLWAAPNPFRAHTMVRFELASPGRVVITIHDVAGRRVRTLVDGPRVAGTHRIPWDGRDASGRPVASGVYVYRLDAGEASLTRRTVRVE